MRFGRGFARSFYAWNNDDAGNGGSGGGEPYAKTKDEAMAKLKAEDLVIMSQTSMDRIVEDRVASTRKTTREEFKNVEDENRSLKAKLDELSKNGSIKGVPQEEVDGLLATKDKEIEASKSEIGRLQGVLKENAILKAAASSVDPGAVAKLLNDQISINETGEIYPVDDKGNRKTGGKDGYMTVDEFVSGYIDQNEYLKSPSGTAGAGSSTAGQGGGSKGNVIDQAASVSMDEFMTKGGLSGLEASQ